METQLSNKVYNALLKICFAERYIQICKKYSRFSDRIISIDKKEILSTLSNLGYKFKYISVSRFYMLDKDVNGFTFRLIFDIKAGVILTTIYVLIDGKFVDMQLSHFSYLMKYFQIDDSDIVGSPTYNSQEDFSKFSKEILSIYEDFIFQYSLSDNFN